MHDKYLCMSPEDFGALASRYFSFQNACNDQNKEPVKVFSPLSEKRLAELYLIREVSKDLEKKKEEDMKKAAALKAEAAEEEKPEEKTEEKTEDNAEEKKPETEK